MILKKVCAVIMAMMLLVQITPIGVALTFNYKSDATAVTRDSGEYIEDGSSSTPEDGSSSTPEEGSSSTPEDGSSSTPEDGSSSAIEELPIEELPVEELPVLTEEDCICETLCSENEAEINAECPVCGAEGADFSLCLGAAVMLGAAASGEQFDLPLGGTYYFDLASEAHRIGKINTGKTGDSGYSSIPDASLHYVPFTYVGTVQGYSLDRNSNGVATTEE
ncbi:MAG: hypothetical protein ACK5L0_01495, partial [Candidatus Fimivivens sp.]